jgi:hypothetical protein
MLSRITFFALAIVTAVGSVMLTIGTADAQYRPPGHPSGTNSHHPCGRGACDLGASGYVQQPANSVIRKQRYADPAKLPPRQWKTRTKPCFFLPPGLGAES